MVTLDERIWYLLLGCLIGYIVRILQEKLGRRKKTDRDERGFMRNPLLADIALLLVVIVTVWAAFSSQRASNELRYTQDRITRVTVCNQQFLQQTIRALNDRTSYTNAQVEANIELQREQARFLSVYFVDPPTTEEQRTAGLARYFQALTTYLSKSQNAAQHLKQKPYPKAKQLDRCLGSAKEALHD